MLGSHWGVWGCVCRRVHVEVGYSGLLVVAEHLGARSLNWADLHCVIRIHLCLELWRFLLCPGYCSLCPLVCTVLICIIWVKRSGCVYICLSRVGFDTAVLRSSTSLPSCCHRGFISGSKRYFGFVLCVVLRRAVSCFYNCLSVGSGGRVVCERRVGKEHAGSLCTFLCSRISTL